MIRLKDRGGALEREKKMQLKGNLQSFQRKFCEVNLLLDRLKSSPMNLMDMPKDPGATLLDAGVAVP